MSDTAVYRVSNPSHSLVAESNHRIEPPVSRNPVEKLGSVAGAEHLVHGGEVGRALVGVEVRRENTSFHALPSEKLAGAAWPSAAAAAALASSHLSHCRNGVV